MSSLRCDEVNPAQWRSQAACRGVDPELFFPTAEAGPERDRQVAAAKKVCAGCPVRAACLTEALARIPYGIAGGLTEHERRRRRPRTAARLPEDADVTDVLIAGIRPNLTNRQRAGFGLALLADGRSSRQVAQLCEVTRRTAERWAQRVQAAANDAGEGSRGGNRAPLRISTAQNALADDSTERT